MTSTSSRIGLILPTDVDAVGATVGQINDNATKLDTLVNVSPVTAFPAAPFNGQEVWYTYGANTGGLYRYDAASANWHAVRSPNTDRGYVSQNNFTNQLVSILINNGVTISTSINTIATPYKADHTYEVISQGNLIMTGTPPANSTVDIHHYLLISTGGMTNPDMTNGNFVGYRLQSMQSSNVGQRIPFYVSSIFNSQVLAFGADHVDHVLLITGNFTGAQIGVDSTTASAGFNKMFFYDRGSNAFG
jgi:hypothetical protein